MYADKSKLNDTTSPDSPSIEFIPETNEPFSSYQNQSNSSRPTSPEIEFLSTNTMSKSPIREETSIPPKDLQDRRKSMSWKTFNLKRQLSKVNMKIGINVNTEIDNIKNNSVFYTQKEVSPEESGGESTSPKNISVKNENKDFTCDLSDEMDTDQVNFDGKHKNTFQTMGSNNPCLATDEDTLDDGDIFDISNDCLINTKKVEFENGALEDCQSSRPRDLPLHETGNINQTENVYKTARNKFTEKQRDQRLLSVPNIKYQTRDIRTRTNKIDSSPSFSGNFSKKICGCGSDAIGNIFAAKSSFQDQIPTSLPYENSEAVASPSCSEIGATAHQGVQQQGSIQSETLRKSRSQDKLDGSFSRSRSSSMSSIDMSSSESVTSLAFIESYGRKNDCFALVPTLWVGTSFGSILNILITLPEKELRRTQPVLVAISGGPLVRLKGSVTSMSFLDSFGSLMAYSFESWRDEREGKKDRTPTKSSSKTSPTFTPTTANTISSTPVGNLYSSSNNASSSGVSGSLSTGLDTLTDRQYIVITSEKQTKVFDIANQSCIYRNNLSEMDFAVKAQAIAMKDGTCLATYLSNGHLTVHSLPSLRLLLDTDFLPLMELSFQTKCKQGIVDPMLSIWGQQIIVHEDTTQISKIFSFSHKGHGLYMATPTEIQKFTISSEFCQFILEMMGELYTSHEMPEQPKESFFKGLFGGGSKSLDREELFGEQSGKANRSVAKHIPGPNLEQLGQRASTAASEISRAHQLAMERGEKLNLLEERAERMANTAQDFSGTAHQLMLKYKDKKWYQL